MKHTFFIILLVFHFLITGGSQAEAQDFKFYTEVPQPSSDAWNYIKYGEVEASLYTGTARVSIPVYTYRDADFEIPVSLDYSSGGNQPNVRAGLLGPGWLLNAGGCITSEIRGIADYGENYKQVRGFKALSDHLVYQEDLGKLWRYVYLLDGGVSQGASSPEILYCPNGPTPVSNDKYDAEPDLFHFHFMGYSGTFNLGYNGQIYIYNTNVDKHEFRIEILSRPAVNPDLCSFSNIQIITGDGYRYVFDCSSLDSPNLDLQQVTGAGYKQITAWRLSRIVAPNGRTARFTYQRYSGSSYYPGASIYTGHIEDHQPSVPGIGGYDPPYYFQSGMSYEFQVNRSDYKTGVLTGIEIDDGPGIFFSYSSIPYSESDQYRKNHVSGLESFGDCLRLTGIQVKRGGNEVLKSVSLGYRVNTNGARTNYLGWVDIAGEGRYDLDYYHWNDTDYPYPPNGTLSVDHWGYYNGKNIENSTSVHYFPLSSLNYDLDESITGTSRNADWRYSVCGMLRRITYPTGGYSELEYEAHRYSGAIKRISQYHFQPVLRAESGEAGGVRIRKVSNYLSNGVSLQTREYEYTTGGASSGILLYSPRYRIDYDAFIFGYPVSENASYCSSNLFSYGSPHLEYSSVVEKHDDGSKVQYRFTNSGTGPAYMDQVVVVGSVKEPFLCNTGSVSSWDVSAAYLPVHEVVAPVTSRQWSRGKLLSKRVYKSPDSFTPILTEDHSYNSDSVQFGQHLPCYLVRKFGYYLSYVDTYKETGVFTTQYTNDDRTGVSTGNCYTYNATGQVCSVSRTDSRGVRYVTEYEYLSDLSSLDISRSAVYTTMQDQHLTRFPLSEQVYVEGASGSRELVSGKKTVYGLFQGLVKPSRIELYDRISGEWYTDVTYTMYDTLGNLLESADRNGILTSYVWGYHGVYLVCRAENVALSQVTAVTGSSAALSGGLSSSQQSALRNNCPGALFSFYDYHPFVGLSKYTAPSGEVTEYTYTGSGKLESLTEGGDPRWQYEYSTDH